MTEQPTAEGERTRIDRGDRLEVRIEGLANGGKGIARVAVADRSYVIFVRDTVPGDLVRIEVTKRKRAFAEARPLEMLEPGPDRIEPLADHPGAAWQVLSYERQLEVKSEQVDDALRRIGKLDGFELEPIIPAVEEWRYRNKLEFSFGVEEDGTLCCGFHAPGSWSRILPMDDCLLASEATNRIREAALEVCQEMGLKAYDRRTHEGLLRNLVVREGRRTGQIQARIVTSPGDFDQRRFADAMIEAGAISVIRTVAPSSGETTQGGTDILIDGVGAIEEECSGLRFSLGSEAFFQTNTEMAEKLYATVGEYADLKGWERVYDLCCGIGSIGLTLAPRAGEVIGVEIVEEAVEDARRNARTNEITNARFIAGNVRVVLKEDVDELGRPDLIVLDPPRSGLSAKVIARVAEAGAKKIVYVSCNPTTLAPNAAQIVEAGYKLVRVRPVDMFPQTPHIECVALFERA